jgi:Uma2 family endonuclease
MRREKTSPTGRESAMTTVMAEASRAAIVYPESDGKPLSDNTKQARWMVVLHGNLEVLFRGQNVFVALNLMWYARENEPSECAAPDVFVAFGRPTGDRRSYKQWEEAGVAPQVVIEILSPSNTQEEMEEKDAFYTDHGVEEYYVYNPEKDDLSIYVRKGTVLRRQWVQNEFTSPRLGIRFYLTGPEMQVFYPDGRRFLTFPELEAERAKETELRVAAEKDLQVTEEKLHSAEEKLKSAGEKLRRLAELGRKARHGQTTPEEAAELERLENEVR